MKEILIETHQTKNCYVKQTSQTRSKARYRPGENIYKPPILGRLVPGIYIKKNKPQKKISYKMGKDIISYSTYLSQEITLKN